MELKRVVSSAVVVFVLVAFQAWPADTQQLDALVERITQEVEQLKDGAGPVSDRDQDKVAELIGKGLEAHEAGDFAKALRAYDKAIERAPTIAVAHFEKAFTLNAMGDQHSAFEEVTRAVLLDPEFDQALLLRASLLDDLGFSDRAEAALRQLVEANPDDFMPHLNLGVTLMRRSEWEAARSSLERARELRPDHPSPYLHLAMWAASQGQEYEEKRFLEEFVKRGAEDPRLPAVEERLNELSSHDITVDSGDPFLSMQLTERLARSLWKSEKHQETFPDAKGYFPSYEEEHDVLANLVLPLWRDLKQEDPEKEHARYDMLLAIDDAGFLDEYIWYVNQNLFKNGADVWLAEHQDRVAAFLAWARDHGYLASEAASDDDTSAQRSEENEEEGTNLPLLVMTYADQSELTYTLGPLEDEEGQAYLKRESRRFQRHLGLDGPDRVDRKQAREVLAKPRAITGYDPLIVVLRTHLPGDDEWSRAAGLFRGLGVVMRDLAPSRPLPLSLHRSGDEVTVAVKLDTSANWMIYALAKAVARHEDGLRGRLGLPTGGDPSVAEEVFAWSTLVQGYLNASATDTGEDQEADPPEPDPYLDRLVQVAQSGDVEGFVLFEVIHKTYGVPLDRLSDDQVKRLEDYLVHHVLVRASDEGDR